MGRKVSERTGKPPEVQYLFQRISVLVKASIQSFFHETFSVEDDADICHCSLFYSLF